MKARVVAVAVVLALVPSFTVVLAEQGEMRVRFGALFNNPTDDLEEPGETLEVDDAFGFQASFEYQVTDLIGIEPTLSLANHDVQVTDALVPDFDLGEIDYLAVTANVNFHVTPARKYDFYLGPTIGFVMWGDLETDTFPGGDFSTDDEFTYGANLGVDVPFGGSKWAFSAAASYLLSEVSLESGSGDDLGVDPLQLKAGVSYQF